MNTLQTTLAALEAQLESQKQVLIDYEVSTYDNQMLTLTQKIRNWLTEYTGIDNHIKFCGDNLQIPLSEQYRDRIDIYFRMPYHIRNSEDVVGELELGWYGSNCKASDNEKVEYLMLLGKIASKMKLIESEYQAWYNEYKVYKRDLQVYYSAMYTTESAIRDTKQLITKAGIEEYKKVGFKCVLTQIADCTRNYDIKEGEIGDYKIKQSVKSIKLQYGYGRFDYMWVESFEIVKQLGRGKLLFKCNTDTSDTSQAVSGIELTPKFYTEFINEVYNWQTIQAQKSAEKAQERYEKYATKA